MVMVVAWNYFIDTSKLPKSSQIALKNFSLWKDDEIHIGKSGEILSAKDHKMRVCDVQGGFRFWLTSGEYALQLFQGTPNNPSKKFNFNRNRNTMKF